MNPWLKLCRPTSGAKFHQIYDLSTSIGEVKLQPELEPWVKTQFGSVEAITHQKIVRLLNRVSQEEVFINEQRASGPTEGKSQINLSQELQNAARADIFAEPESHTSEDIIGRIRGQYCLTAGNITKTDGYHGVVIFNDLNPLAFTR